MRRRHSPGSSGVARDGDENGMESGRAASPQPVSTTSRANLLGRVVSRLLLPIALGGAIGWAGSELLGEPLFIIIVVPLAMLWCVRELRWTRRMLCEIDADRERLIALGYQCLPRALARELERDLRDGS